MRFFGAYLLQDPVLEGILLQDYDIINIFIDSKIGTPWKTVQFYQIISPIPRLFHSYFTGFVEKIRADFICRISAPPLYPTGDISHGY